jgi:uncharacterized protein (DUF433 family)
MSNVASISDPFRTGMAYTVSEASRIVGTSAQNVRRWLRGYEAPGHRMEPVFGVKNAGADEPLQVSFLQLVEIAVVVAFRSHGVSLKRLRDAHAYARTAFDFDYPFASMDLGESGGHVLHQFEEERPDGKGKLVELDGSGQFVLPEMVKVRILEFDFVDRLAVRWFPFGRTVPVVIDPHLAAGNPTVHGTRVTVETLRKRWKAGEPMASIADDLELEVGDVESILQRAA